MSCIHCNTRRCFYVAQKISAPHFLSIHNLIGLRILFYEVIGHEGSGMENIRILDHFY